MGALLPEAALRNVSAGELEHVSPQPAGGAGVDLIEESPLCCSAPALLSIWSFVERAPALGAGHGGNRQEGKRGACILS